MSCAPQRSASRRSSCSSRIPMTQMRSPFKPPETLCRPQLARPRSRRDEKYVDHLQKGASKLLRLTDRLSVARHVRDRFWVLFLERGWIFRLCGHGSADARGDVPHECQRTGDTAAGFQRGRDRAFPYSHDYYAALRGREAKWNDRTPGDSTNS